MLFESQIAFLHTRENVLDSASLVACGTGGWVQMWNVVGGGLIGEFNIWDTKRHRLPEEERSLECVTALKIDSNDETMLTGNSLGYVQVRTAVVCVCVCVCVSMRERERERESAMLLRLNCGAW